MSAVGSGGYSAASNIGRIFFALKPQREREKNVDEIIRELRPKLTHVPGIKIFLQNTPTIRVGDKLTKSQYQLTLQSPDTAELYKAAKTLEAKMQDLPELRDVTSGLQLNNPQVNIRIDRDKSSALGITSRQIEDTLYYAYGSKQVSTIYAPNNQYQVILELEPEYQMDPAALSLLYVRTNSDKLVPLNTISTLTKDVGPLSVNHLGQLPAVTISFDLKTGIALSDAINAVEELAHVT